MAATLWFAEQRVNTSTAGNQSAPAISKLNNGGFVVVWQDFGTGSGDIRAQLFSAAGVRVGNEFVIANTAGAEVDPWVVTLSDGRFRVAWEDGVNIGGAIYNQDGTLSAAASGYTNGTDGYGAQAAGGGVNDVIVNSTDISFVRLNSAGAVLGSTVVNTTVAGSQVRPDIVRLANGDFAVTWITPSLDVRGRVMNPDGTPQSAEFLVSSGTVTGVGRSAVTALTSGGFIIVWSQQATAFPGNSNDIFGRLFDAAGNAVAAPFIMNTTVAGEQNMVDVVALRDGGFMALWWDANVSGSRPIRGIVFDAFGERVGTDFLVSNGAAGQTTGFPRVIQAVLLDDGRVAVVFTGATGLGDSDESIRLQIIDPRDGQVEGTFAADTLYGGQFDDQISGLDGADTIFALSGQDVVYGGLGADTIFGDVGDDILYGGDDNDVLNAGTGADVVYGELGNDQVFAELGDDLVFAGDGNDTINGGAGDDAVYGQNGDDVMFGDAGADAFFGGFGNDTLFLGIGNDVGFGEEGGDTLIGDDGDDVLDGGAGGDVLNGGNGVDNLIGGGEGDILIGGPGGDRLEGGAGGDLYWWQAQTELNDLVVGFNSAEDQLQFTGSQFGGFTAGSNLLNGSTFISSANPNPTGAAPTFLYNNVDGSLFFDPDGTGGAARVFVALFQGAPALTAGDFQFV